MLSFLLNNIGTIAVLLIVAAVAGLIIYKLHKDKKSGKPLCGGDCGSCGGHCSGCGGAHK